MEEEPRLCEAEQLHGLQTLQVTHPLELPPLETTQRLAGGFLQPSMRVLMQPLGQDACGHTHTFIHKERDASVWQQDVGLPPTDFAENLPFRKSLVLLASGELCDGLKFGIMLYLKSCLHWKLPYGYQGQLC